MRREKDVQKSAAAQLRMTRLAEFLSATKLCPYAAAKRLGISHNTLKNFGRGCEPHQATVESIAAALYMSAEDVRAGAKRWLLPDEQERVEAESVVFARAVHADADRTSSPDERNMKYVAAGRILRDRLTSFEWRGLLDLKSTVTTVAPSVMCGFSYIEQTRSGGYETSLSKDGAHFLGARVPLKKDPTNYRR